MSNKDNIEKIKRVDDKGLEYWSSRELSKFLGYSEYRHFVPVIEKAKEECKKNGQKPSDHFEEHTEEIIVGNSGEVMFRNRQFPNT